MKTLLLAAVLLATPVRDNGQWQSESPQVHRWFQNLMQPDNPTVSCCGESDAYEADNFEVEGDHYVAIITDTRPDAFSNGTFRPHIDPGTHIPVPNEKMKWDKGNPTGHGIIFLSASDGHVYCYVAPAGI